MPGSGKSTIGRILAKKVSMKFLDLDECIHEKTGKYIREILKEYGDNEVIRLENEMIQELDLQNSVISPGGSIVYSSYAMKKLQEETHIMYLEVSLDTLQKRVGNIVNNSRGIVHYDSLGFDGVYAERQPLFKQYAHDMLEIHDQNPEEIANIIQGMYSNT